MNKLQNKPLPPGVVKRLERTIYHDLVDLEKIEPSKIVEIIYSTADYYYKHAIQKDAVCKKGCSWCCRVPVDVSALEVQYISEKTGIKPNGLEKGKDWSRDPDKTKCPFLKDGCCSIYEHRPYNCRIFATMDSADFCIDGATDHIIYTWASNGGLTFFRKFLDDLSEVNYQCAGVGDIREWFGPERIRTAEA